LKPGEGGEDARLFANDLANIYLKRASQLNLKSIKTEDSRKRIEIEIKGKNAL